MSCPNCKCKKQNINEEEYNELKEYFQDEILNYQVIDYINDDTTHSQYVEVEFEDYIMEIEDLDTSNLSLDIVIDAIIRKSLV